MKRTFFKKGFTLIEVLVVVALIGILSAIIYANFNDAREDARNKALRSEIKAVQLALELYKSQNGEYPLAQALGSPCSSNSSDVTTASSVGCNNNPIAIGLIPEFIARIPSHKESANPDCVIKYIAPRAGTTDEGTWYKLLAENCFAGASEASEGIQSEDTMARCPASCSTCSGNSYSSFISTAPFYETFAVYSVGSQCE